MVVSLDQSSERYRDMSTLTVTDSPSSLVLFESVVSDGNSFIMLRTCERVSAIFLKDGALRHRRGQTTSFTADPSDTPGDRKGRVRSCKDGAEEDIMGNI